MILENELSRGQQALRNTVSQFRSAYNTFLQFATDSSQFVHRRMQDDGSMVFSAESGRFNYHVYPSEKGGVIVWADYTAIDGSSQSVEIPLNLTVSQVNATQITKSILMLYKSNMDQSIQLSQPLLQSLSDLRDELRLLPNLDRAG